MAPVRLNMALGATTPNSEAPFHGSPPISSPYSLPFFGYTVFTQLRGLSTVSLWFRSFTSTPQIPFKEPQIPSSRVYKALNRGTLGGLGISKFQDVPFRHDMLTRTLQKGLPSGPRKLAQQPRPSNYPQLESYSPHLVVLRI